MNDNIDLEHRLTTIESLLKTLLAGLVLIGAVITYMVGQVQVNSEWRRGHENYIRETNPYRRLDAVERDMGMVKTVLKALSALLVPIVIYAVQEFIKRL